MRQPAPHRPPVALTIAGSDSGGGAGIQADLKTMEAHGVFATSVLTAVTAQNTVGVRGSHVLPLEEIREQLSAVADDVDLGAAKTGMLATRQVIQLVTEFADGFDGPLVVDPVMVAASGDRLLEPEAEAAYEDLAAHATVLTPNADEAAVLTGRDVDDVAAAVAAGRDIVDLGADAALVKGGHLDGDEVVDVLVTDEGVERFTHPRIETDATHGSGCALASAIAARMARGEPRSAAVEAGVDFMERAVRYHVDVGEGPGAVHHLSALRERADRDRTAEAVRGLVERLVDLAVSPLVPEVGMNVAGATPFAEREGEVAAVDGRIQATMSGVRANGDVRFGASGHVARFLLGAREFEPALRFACNCRFDAAVEAALGALDWPVAAVDREGQPDDVAAAEGSTMEWAARQAFGGRGEPPVAVFDRGAVGKERMCRIVARDAATLGDRLAALHDAVAVG
jgi:hydroxymethylpyrimidine/phosphomethylpyrimidine kinase